MAFTVNSAPNAAGVQQDINTYHRKYHKEIWTRIRSMLKAEMYMSSFMSVKNQYVITTAAISDVIKKFACDFEPGPDVTFQPKIMEVCRMKADIEICCLDDLWSSYMADMFDLGMDNHTPVRFIQWIFDTLVIPKIVEELEFASVSGWTGATPAGGVTSNYTNVVDGVGTLAERIANNGQGEVVPTGAITAATALDQVETLLAAIPKKNRTGPNAGVLWMSEQSYRKFWLDRRADLGANMDYASLKASGNVDYLVDDYTKIQIHCFDGLDGSDLMFYTPKWNIRKLFNTIDMPTGGGFTTDRQDRCLHMMQDWHRGYGFIFDEYVWVNDQPLHGAANV